MITKRIESIIISILIILVVLFATVIIIHELGKDVVVTESGIQPCPMCDVTGIWAWIPAIIIILVALTIIIIICFYFEPKKQIKHKRVRRRRRVIRWWINI